MQYGSSGACAALRSTRFYRHSGFSAISGNLWPTKSGHVFTAGGFGECARQNRPDPLGLGRLPFQELGLSCRFLRLRCLGCHADGDFVRVKHSSDFGNEGCEFEGYNYSNKYPLPNATYQYSHAFMLIILIFSRFNLFGKHFVVL